MEFTIVGVIWLIFLIISLFCSVKWIVSLLVISCVFQATAVINTGDKGFSPFIFTEFFFILKNIHVFLSQIRLTSPLYKNFKILLYFFIVTVLITIFAPSIFEGVKVYVPSLGIDDNYYIGGRQLKFTSSNIIQLLYLLLDIITIYLCYKIANHNLYKVAIKSFYFSIFFVVFVGFWEYSSSMFGLGIYPKDLFVNNSGYALLNNMDNGLGFIRLTSTFMEPSYTGGFLAASFWALFSIQKIWARVACLLVFITLCFTMSGTGIAAFIIGGIICLSISNLRLFVTFTILSIFLFVILTFLKFDSIILDILQNKSTSQSGINRQGSNDFSIKVFMESYGIGVGLGSHRASSFFYTIIASVGVASILLFYYLFCLFRTMYRDSKLFRLYAEKTQINQSTFLLNFSIVLLVSQILAIPDISLPPFWMWQFTFFLNPNFVSLHRDYKAIIK